jgi:nicotinamidase-related amidase
MVINASQNFGASMVIPNRDNAAILFLDLQAEIVKNSATLPVDRLTRSAAVLAKLAALHKLPYFLSAVPPGGDFLDAVLAPLGHPAPRMRTQTSAFADAGLTGGLQASGRNILILAGVASEIVVQRTALDALAAGYQVQIAVDACGGVNARTEDAAWRRIGAAGGVTTSVTTFAAELTGDFTTELGGATLGLVYETLGG